MPRNACLHCPEGFISRDLLERHVHFVHPDGPTQTSAPPVVTQAIPQSTGYLAMVSAHPAATSSPSALAKDDDASDNIGPRRPQRAHLPGTSRFRLSDIPDLPASGGLQFTQSIESMMDTLGPRPTTEQAEEADKVAPATPATRPLLQEPVINTPSATSISLAVRPSEHGPVRFTIVYVAEAQNFSRMLRLPNTTPWPRFLNELAAVSMSVAQQYIPERSDGFRLNDGAWRFSLADNQGVEGRWRPLTRILFYQAMISELLKPDTPWKHAQVWHVSQIPVEGINAAH